MQSITLKICADEFKRFVTDFMNGHVAPAWKYDGPFVMEG